MQNIHYCVDMIYIKDNRIRVVGWVFSKKNKNVDIKVKGIDDIEIKKMLRPDVKNAFSDCEHAANSGFDLIFDLKNKKEKIIEFSDEEVVITHVIDIKSLLREKRLVKVNRLIGKIKKFNLTNIKKGIIYGRKNGLKALFKKITLCLNIGNNSELDYHKWFINNFPSLEELDRQREEKFKDEPTISIVVPIYNTPKKFLIDMIESVRNQSYSNWELCIADGASSLNETRKILKDYEKKDKRIKVRYLDKNYMISGNTNEALKLATGEYIGLFDHDDLLTENCLYEVVKVINETGADFIYTDEDKVEESGKEYFEPHFKPDWSPDTLRSYNYICHFSVFKKELLKQVGNFKDECNGSQDYDMFLRLTEKAKKIHHIHKVLYHWRVHKNSTAMEFSNKLYVIDAAKKALEDHLKRQNIKGVIKEGLFPTSYKIDYNLIDEPKVSIIIPNKDSESDLKKCINSIINKSTYMNYEIIIVENNSVTKEIFLYYKEIQKNKKVTVVKYKDQGFNYSAINNYGIGYASGEYIILLNNDIEVITPNWIEEMLKLCQQNDVGIVGSKLYYPDDTVQHAGVILGIGGIAGHSHKYFKRNENGHAARLKVVQNLSAVTAACLMIKKSIYDKVGGLDEKFKVAFNDIDLCLKVRQEGMLIVWTPYAEMYHYESKTRGAEDTPEKIERFKGEIERFKEKWGKTLDKGDEYYNKNLTLERENFSLR